METAEKANVPPVDQATAMNLDPSLDLTKFLDDGFLRQEPTVDGVPVIPVSLICKSARDPSGKCSK